jgi:hypothetical protein
MKKLNRKEQRSLLRKLDRQADRRDRDTNRKSKKFAEFIKTLTGIKRVEVLPMRFEHLDCLFLTGFKCTRVLIDYARKQVTVKMPNSNLSLLAEDEKHLKTLLKNFGVTHQASVE